MPGWGVTHPVLSCYTDAYGLYCSFDGVTAGLEGSIPEVSRLRELSTSYHALGSSLSLLAQQLVPVLFCDIPMLVPSWGSALVECLAGSLRVFNPHP